MQTAFISVVANIKTICHHTIKAICTIVCVSINHQNFFCRRRGASPFQPLALGLHPWFASQYFFLFPSVIIA